MHRNWKPIDKPEINKKTLKAVDLTDYPDKSCKNLLKHQKSWTQTWSVNRKLMDRQSAKKQKC